MVRPGDKVFLVCKGETGKIRIKGTVVEEVDDDNLVVGIDPDIAKKVSNSLLSEKSGGSPPLGFIKVPVDSVSSVLPAGWENATGGQAPKLNRAAAAWKSLGSQVGIESSETEKLPGKETEKSSGSQRKMEQELLQMSQELWGEGSNGEESSSDDGSTMVNPGTRHLAPGAGSMPKKASKNKGGGNSDAQEMLQKVMLQNLASGGSPSDMVPLMMMSMMLNQQQGKKSKSKGKSKSLDPGTSSSEDSEEGELSRDSGMKAVVTLNKLHRKVKHHPKQIIKQFEKELLEEMGVVPGQAWSIRDWLKRQSWGKFKGIYRTAVQDAAVYELLRSGETDQATAQLVQNMKSKLQSVLSGGDWATAWLMTGLPDPLSRKEWAGNKEEMAVISGYLNSLNRLKKKMKEAGTTANEDQE